MPKTKKSKRCSKCRKIKRLSEFYKDKYKKSGHASACKVCKSDSFKSWQQKNKGYCNTVHKDWVKNNPKLFRAGQYKTRYGITLDDYNKMFQEQNGCCAICGIHQSELKKKLHVDHSHKSGKVRGLLCGKCNLALGLLNDDIVVLSTAVRYLGYE